MNRAQSTSKALGVLNTLNTKFLKHYEKGMIVVQEINTNKEIRCLGTPCDMCDRYIICQAGTSKEFMEFLSGV